MVWYLIDMSLLRSWVVVHVLALELPFCLSMFAFLVLRSSVALSDILFLSVLLGCCYET